MLAILSQVESRQVKNDYTWEFERPLYAILRTDIGTGLRGAAVRVEKRRDGSVAIRFGERYLSYELRDRSQPVQPARQTKPVGSRKGPNAGGKSDWMKSFLKTRGPSLDKALVISNATS